MLENGGSGAQPGLLDPETIKRLRRLNLTAKLIVRSFLQGLNTSLTKGCSIDFADLREYSPGDDLRLLDWKAYARTDRFYVKQFEAERDATIIFLLDSSPSMTVRAENGPAVRRTRSMSAALIPKPRLFTASEVVSGWLTRRMWPSRERGDWLSRRR